MIQHRLQLLNSFLVLSASFLISAQRTSASAEKISADDDASTTNNDTWVNLELIPRDQLCLLCHSVITKFQQASSRNPHQFKDDLLTSCALLKDVEEIKKCRNGITDEQLAKLNTTSVDDICIAQKLCKEDKTVNLNDFDTSIPSDERDVDEQELEAIPDVKGAEDAHSADDPRGFKAFAKSQDLIQNAYAK